MQNNLIEEFRQKLDMLDSMGVEDKVDAINQIREAIHEKSPFKSQPVDFVKWVKNDTVHQNDYNPNSVAPPEMELLRLSIDADGYTQPIVSMPDMVGYEVVDGFHRHRVGKECKDINERVHGYLPLVQIRTEQYNKTDRMASTIRHNRARGKHKVEAMSDIVVELKKRNWSDDKIAKELGMEADEVLRLCQITGLSELFSSQDFSKSWDVEGFITQEELNLISEDEETFEDEVLKTKTVNTENRVFHTYDKWECFEAGFYATKVEGMNKEECQTRFRDFFKNLPLFEQNLDFIITNWKYSCEHYLSNPAMNRIAWLGQAAVCLSEGIPSSFRSGWSLLTEQEQDAANNVALVYLNRWLVAQGEAEVSLNEAAASGRQSVIY